MNQIAMNLNTDEELRTIRRTEKALDNAQHLARLAAAMVPSPSDWEYRGEVVDGAGADEKCTCGHPIRWVFLIRRKSDDKALKIGSTCIETSVPYLIANGAADLADTLAGAVESHKKALRDAATAERRRAREIAQDETLAQLHADWAALLEWRRARRMAYYERGDRIPYVLYRSAGVPRPTKTKTGTIKRLVREYNSLVAWFRSDSRSSAGLPTPKAPELQPAE